MDVPTTTGEIIQVKWIFIGRWLPAALGRWETFKTIFRCNCYETLVE